MAGATATVTIKGIFDASDIQNKVRNIQNILSNLKMPDKLKADFMKSFEGLDRAFTDFQNKANKGINNKQDAKTVNASYDNIVREFEKVDQVIQKIKAETNGAVDLSNFIKIDDSVKAKIENISKEIEDLQKQINSINGKGIEEIVQAFDKLKTDKSKEKIADALNIFKNAKGLEDIEKAIQMIEQAKQSYANLAKSNTPGGQTSKEIVAGYDEIINKMREVQQASSGLQEQMNGKVDERFNLTAQEVERLKNQVLSGASAFGQYKTQAKGVGDGLKGATSAMGDFGSELEQVRNRISYFLGLSNAINLFKRAVKSSINTVKDLDKAMTETAVVTDYTVGDMWKQLPEYTKRANQLGVTTKAAYESATLYYQQGLNSEQAAALSTETLKMARIAGLDAAEATDRMTNALRGFNMELDTASAKRIDDVYSQLAAMSASNVDEISTAMTKVASLAHNANMEFETTSAFLAQIIETTRESAETAGTALKTVVARFSEVKDLYEKDELKGQDEEGQAIDVNRVSQALRSAGIDLNKYFLGEVGLDDIFMELASKWDSLTSIQQRYIATQAAGSRQQSRFIALMQDYSRTQELVGAAYNSSGASEKQFEKTQDSLESKLARLTNAWNEFLMGIANNNAIKLVVDGLTTLLNFINKITGALGDVGGSFAKLGIVAAGIGGLKAGLNSNWFRNLLEGFSNSPLGSFLSGRGFQKAAETAKDTASAATAGATLEGAAAAAGSTIEGAAAAAASTTEAAASSAASATTQAASATASTIEQGAQAATSAVQQGGSEAGSLIQQSGSQFAASVQGAGGDIISDASTAGSLLVQGATQAKAILSGQTPTGGAEVAGQKLLGAGNVGQPTGVKLLGNGSNQYGSSVELPDGTVVLGAGSTEIPSRNNMPGIGEIIDVDYEVVDEIGQGATEATKAAANAEAAAATGAKAAETAAQTANTASNVAKITTDAAEAGMEAAEVGAEAGAGAAAATKTAAATGLKAVGSAIPWLLALAAAAFATYKMWEYFTPEGQLKQSQQAAEAIRKVENSSDQMAKAAQEAYDAYKEKTVEINEATSVTGRKKAIEERNDYINSLVQQDQNYAKYIKANFENGQYVLSIDEKDLKEYAEVSEEVAKVNQTSSLLAQAMVAGNQARVYQSNIERRGVDFEKGTIQDNQYYIDEFGDTQIRKVTRQMTSSEIQTYRNYQTQARQKNAEAKAIAAQSFMQMVDPEVLGDELGELVAGAMAEGFDPKKQLDQRNKYKNQLNWGYWDEEQGKYKLSLWNEDTQEFGGWLRGKKYWQKQYADIFGAEPDKELSASELKEAIAQKQAQLDEQENTNLLSDLVNSNQKLYTPILKAVNGQFGNEVTATTNVDEYVQSILKGANMETLAKAMNKTTEEVEAIVKDNVQIQKEINANKTAEFGVKAYKAGAKADTLKKLLNLNPEEVNKILDFSDAAEQSLGKGVAEFYDKLPQYIEEGQLDNISNFFGTLNLDEPLSAVQKLNDAISDKSNPAIQELAKKVKEANAQLSDVGYLTQMFMTSEAYESISDSVDDLIEKNGKISADEVEELAKSCKDLKILLDQDSVSAQGLSRALTAVGSGKASIEGITSAVLKTLGATQSANTAIDKLFKSIDEFDAGRDLTKAVDFANDKIAELKDSLENLEFGNETFRKNYEYFFSDYEKFAKLDTQGRKSLLESNIERLDNLLKDDALGALRELSQISGSGLKITHEDEEQIDFNWDIGDKTWNELRKSVSDELNVNEQIAETIMTAAAAYMPELRESLDLNAFKKDIKTFNEEVKKEGAITEQELQVLAQAYGKTTDEVYAQMKASAKEQNIELPIRVSWQDKNGANLSGQELIDKFNQDIGKLGHIVRDNDIRIEGNLDADKFLQVLQQQYKLTEDQAKTIANDYAQSTGSLFTKTIQTPEFDTESSTWTVKEVQVEATSIQALEAAVQLKENEAQWAQMATMIAQALSQIPVGLEPDTNAAIATIDGALTGLSYQVAIYGVYYPPDNMPSNVSTNGANSTTPTGKTGTELYNNWKQANSGKKVWWLNDALGGKVGSYANGSRHISPGIALTGEEGPELVWNKEKGYAYFTGKNGPEFANLIPGDQIFPADETKRIVNRGETPAMAKGGKVYPSFAEVDGSRKKPKDKDKDKSSGDKKKDDEFKMDLDKYYNMVEDINELLRLRELLEKNYNQLLKQEGKTGKEIYDNLTKQLNLLEERRKITEDLAEKRKQQILDLVEENKELADFAWWNDEDLTIEIDWDLVNTIDDKDKGSEVKDYLSKLEDFQSKYDEQIEALEDIEDAVQEIRERGKDQYNSLEERTRDALIKAIQDRIDELKDVEEAVNDTNQRLFESMQQTLEQQRQQRDNAKTEEELTDKEKRLAYLQQDSSNANALEIAQLQEELADARQDYTDSLIDQKISELQRQNDEAQEQRQQQIDLMQRSLDWQEKSGAFWETVYQYISEGTDAVGALIHESELEKLLKTADSWDQLSEEQKKSWAQELIDQVTQGIAYLELTRQLEDIGTKEGTKISFTVPSGETLTGTVDKNGNVVVKNSDGSTTTYKDIFQDYHGQYRTFEEEGEVKKAATGTKKGTGNTTTTDTGTDKDNGKPETWGKWTKVDNKYCQRTSSKGRIDKKEHDFKASFNAVNKDQLKYTCTRCGYVKSLISPVMNNITEEVEKVAGGGGNTISVRKKMKYASGGLSTQTGLAWLDGTLSEPELVLNARDTQNFIELKDVLADMRKSGGLSLAGGDNYYDIDVHVDSMSSDYDVDRAIDRIKARLAQDGAYRNVNTLSRLR